MSALSASNLLLLFVAMWFIGVEVEQETSAPPPKKNSGSAPGTITSYQMNVKHLGTLPFNPLSPKRDQHEISPCNITAL